MVNHKGVLYAKRCWGTSWMGIGQGDAATSLTLHTVVGVRALHQ